MSYSERMEDALFGIRGYCEENEPTSEKILEFLNEAQSFRSFGEGLSELIEKKYRTNSESPKELLKKLAKEKGITINRNTISNWFDGMRPKKGEQSREHMFLIAFALDFTYEETCELFKKVYYDRPFNLRSTTEYIYLYCILTNKSYQMAQKMIEQVCLKEMTYGDETIYTRNLSKEIEMAKSEQEIIDFINAHPHNFSIDSQSAKALVKELVYQIKGRDEEKQLIKEKITDKKASIIARECSRMEGLLDENKSLVSTSSMLDIILGVNVTGRKSRSGDSIFKNAYLPQEIISRFPTKHTFAKDNPSSEELRKMIILLFSYKFWYEKQYENSETDLDDYIELLDEILDTVGLQTLYIGNPFDWMFMYCSIDDCPLDSFRNIIADAFDWECCQ